MVASPPLGTIAVVASKIVPIWHPATPLEISRQTPIMAVASTIAALCRVRLTVIDVGVHPYVIGAAPIISPTSPLLHSR